MSTTPNSNNRRAFANELYLTNLEEFPDCQIYANGFNHRTLVIQRAGSSLFDSVQTERFIAALLSMGFRRAMFMCDDGRIFKSNLTYRRNF